MCWRSRSRQAPIAKLGAVQVSINPSYTARELAHQLRDAGARVIVAWHTAAATVDQVLAQSGVGCVLTVDAGELLGGPGAARPGAVPLATALAAGAALSAALPALSGTDLLLLQYTGGTTGPSKGAALSHGNLSANIAQFSALMDGALRRRQETVVTAIPLYHIFAMTVNFLTCFSIGAENWLVTDGRDMRALVDVLKAARPTVFVGVNTLYAALCAHPEMGDVDWSALRLCLAGGAPTLRTTLASWQAATACFIHEGYGMSETSPVIAFNPPSVQAFNGAVGQLAPSTSVKLLDADDCEVGGAGATGEICVRGPQVMQGYWQQPEANAAAFTADGYLRTGDVGVFDAQGFLSIVDRKKDMLLVSGFNVYPNEIEAIVAEHAGVAECACVGVASEKTGEAVRLFVVRKPGAAVTAAALIDHCRASMAAYKVPKDVRFIDALPKSGFGKILRRALRELV